MRIKAGALTLDEMIWFAEKGAGEIYIALPDIPSHTGRSTYSIKGSVNELSDVFRRVHAKGCKIFVAANETARLGLDNTIKKMLSFFESCSPDGFIVANPQIPLSWPSKTSIPEWHLSSLALCFNSFALKWYEKAGFSRFCIPQHLLPEEADKMLLATNMQSEVFFVLGEMCSNLDGICKGCTGLDESTKFCLRTFNAAGRPFRCSVFSTDTLLRHLYMFSKTADWLKLVRFNNFEIRKSFFHTAEDLIEMAEKAPDFYNFISISEKTVREFLKLKYEN